MSAALRKLVFVLADIDGYSDFTCARESLEIFHLMSSYYEVADAVISEEQGELIKTIGDAIFFVFPDDVLPDFEKRIRHIKDALDGWLGQVKHGLNVSILAHVGEAAIGPITTPSTRWIDTFGNDVNELFMMTGKGIVFSDRLKERLSTP